MGEIGYLISLEDIRDAMHLVSERVHCTPVLKFEALQLSFGSNVYVKAENLQKTGSFKIRGALNKLSRLTESEKELGVVAASAGNHAQGVALAARWLGIRCVVVMPEDAPLIKVVSARKYGAEVILYGDSFDQAYEKARQLEADHGLTFIHAFDDPLIIAGQGTVGLEILRQVPHVDRVVVPVGGGGLISGVAIAIKSIRPGVRVIGVQPEGASSVYRSLKSGDLVGLSRTRTIADGLAVKYPRERTLELVRKWVDEMVLVSEEDIARAILLYLERGRLVTEGAGAVSLAALLAGKLPTGNGHTVIVASGGNIDVNLLARVIEHALVGEGRYLRIVTTIPDKPGSLHLLLGTLVELKVNVISVGHERLQPGLPLGDTEVTLTLEARDRSHAQDILDNLRQKGYTVRVL